jgi:hypothetical protein
MLKQLLQSYRIYEEGKEKATEQTITALESKTNPLFICLFSALIISFWLVAIFTPNGFEQIYNKYEFYPLIGLFIFTYFFFYLGSKHIFKPSAGELSDDTSLFAIFSACGRKEARSLISVGLSFLHTAIFASYLINKDWKIF